MLVSDKKGSFEQIEKKYGKSHKNLYFFNVGGDLCLCMSTDVKIVIQLFSYLSR